MFGASNRPAIDFLPDPESRAWVTKRMAELVPALGAPAQRARVVTPSARPHDLDDLFDLMCDLQATVGQADVEFGVVDAGEQGPEIPAGFAPLGNPAGQLMHTFRREADFVTVVTPAVFRKPELVFAGVARELGRIAVARAGVARAPEDSESDAELAAIALGMGVWVVNGSYLFENACCGGGCGLNLRSLRAGLSMPEACFAAALDGGRKGLSRRSLAKHLSSNQKAAFKRSWSHLASRPGPEALTHATAAALPKPASSANRFDSSR